MLLLGLGFYSNRLFRGTRSDYQVASHSIGPFLLVMSLFGTTMTAFALVGSTDRLIEPALVYMGCWRVAAGLFTHLLLFNWCKGLDLRSKKWIYHSNRVLQGSTG